MRPRLVIAAACLASGAVQAEPLSYAGAIARAVAFTPDLKAAELGVDAARAAARPAGALPDPKASVGFTDFPISGPLAGHPERDDFSMLTLGFSQEVPNRAKRRARVGRAEAEVTQNEAQQAVTAREVQVAAALAWIDLYYAQKKLGALDALSRELKVDAETADARLTSGASRPAATLEPEQLLARLADRRETLRAAVTKARATLERWTGVASPEPFGAAPELRLNEAALRSGLERLPQLLLKSAMVRTAEADRGLAKAEKRSDWGYEVEYSHRDPRFGDYISGKLTFSLPLFSASRQDPIVAARGATVARAYAEREATRRELRAALDGDLAEHAMHHANLARAEATLVPLARRRVELETASYRARTASLTDVLAARRDLVEAELDRLDREADTVRDQARIALTYGEQDQ